MPLTSERIRSRHPFELLFLYIVTATAIAGLSSHEVRPGSIQEGVGHIGTVVWYIALLGGSVVALLGIFWRERATGLVMESVGLFVSGLATIFYGIVALIVIHWSAAYASATIMAYGAAAIWRAAQIRRLLVLVTRRSLANSQE